MGLEAVAAMIEQDNRDIVNSMTWGHLYPATRIKHYGYIIIAVSEYGDVVSIKDEFEDVESSPWFFQDLQNFMFGLDLEEGKIYKFKGYYFKYKNQNCRFTGDITEIKISI